MDIFYLDYLNGSDTARTALLNCVASNPSGTITRITYAGHGLVTGGRVALTLFTAWLNTSWTITWVDADNFDLDGAVWRATADVTGTVTPQGGSSWADAWKTFTGVGSKMAPGDEIRIAKSPDPTSLGQDAQWTSTNIIGGAVPSSVAPASSTNSSPITINKTAHRYATGDIVHIYNHTVNTNANGVWFITKVNDNSFTLDDSVGNGTGGATGNMQRINSKCVVLTTPVTKTISLCDTAWTPGTNVTSANLQQSYFKFGAGCPAIITNASCAANQIVAKFGLAASIDLSSYEQISFWFRCQSMYFTAGQLLIKLYSDAACTSEVESLSIPAFPVYGNWQAVTINKGSALSGTVQGIAIYTTVALPSRTFYIDNIVACLPSTSDDSISLRSLISKNITGQYGDDVFLSIQSIKDRIIILDQAISSNGNTGRGYCGITELVPLYKRESIYTVAPYSGSYILNPVEGGTDGNLIKISGGWNTSLTIRDGISVFCGGNGLGYGLYTTADYLDISNFHFVNGSIGLYSNTYRNKYSNIIATNCSTYGGSLGYGAESLDDIYFILNNGTGLTIGSRLISSSNLIFKGNSTEGLIAGAKVPLVVVDNNGSSGFSSGTTGLGAVEILSACYNGSQGIYISGTATIESIDKCSFNTTGINFAGYGTRIKTIIELNNNVDAIKFIGSWNIIEEITEANNNTNSIFYISASYNIVLKISGDNNFHLAEAFTDTYENYIYNGIFTNWIGPSWTYFNAGSMYLINCTGLGSINPIILSPTQRTSRIFCHNYNAQGVHVIFHNGGTIVSDTTERHTASGISWKFTVNSNIRTIDIPMKLSIAKVLCHAGKTTTVSVWVKKGVDINIGGRLMVVGGKYAGIGDVHTDVFTLAPDSTSWEQISINVTPTYDEVVEVEFAAWYIYGLTVDSIYIDDMSITEAP
jgi:hypothetical protein